MAMTSGGPRLISVDSDQEYDDVTMMTTLHSGDKQACVSETHTVMAKKKGNSMVGDESVDNLVSLMSKIRS